MSADFLSAVLVLLFLSVLVVFIGLRFKIPAIIGFLITGVLVGPYVFKIFENPELIDNLAELGVVLLLFTIGLEFSVSSLMRIKKTVLLGGGLQVGSCILVTVISMEFFDTNWRTALLFGFLFALSSSAIVLKLFQEQGHMSSVYGQSSLAVLIFQDLAVVPMVLVLPLLAGSEGGQSFYWVLLKAVLVLGFVLFMATFGVPKLLKKISLTKSRELFMFSVALICLGTAFLTYKAGLSLALGAFVAGLVIASSPYVYQALGSILPIRDIFTSFFFVSIGMLLNVDYLLEHPILTILACLGIMGLNIIGTVAAMRIIGLNWRLAFMIAFALCQVGEFSFVLAKEGLSLGLLSSDSMALFLNAAVLTMALTPLAMFIGEKIGANLPDSEFKAPDSSQFKKGRGHVIVVGYSVVGKSVARACQLSNTPYEIVELNPKTVRIYKERGKPIIYGDAVNESVLSHLGILEAKVLAITVLDPIATKRIIVTAKNLNPNIYIVVRSRFVAERDDLINLGADEIVPEEYETALAMFEIIMGKFLILDEEFKYQVDNTRAGGYLLFRSRNSEGYKECNQFKDSEAHLDLVSTSVEKNSPAENLKVVDFIKKYEKLSFQVLLLKKGKKVFANPDEEILQKNDIIVLDLDDYENSAEVLALFRPQLKKEV